MRNDSYYQQLYLEYTMKQFTCQIVLAASALFTVASLLTATAFGAESPRKSAQTKPAASAKPVAEKK
jgi:hypothetical protein